MKHILIAFLLISQILVDTKCQPSDQGQLQYLFKSGTNGYNTYRIPAIITTLKGTILCFAEGRKNGASDTGDIDLVMKRSEDYGKTWSDNTIVWNDSLNVCGNPAPVQDKATGKIFLLCTWNLGTDKESEIINETSKDIRKIYVLTSSDDGRSWTDPKEITSSVKLANWTWYATGPCHGIQTLYGKHKGRLLIPCDHIEAGTKKYFSHIIYSDDHGTSWHLGGTTPQDQVNECTVAELKSGRLILNMRNYDRTQKSRKISQSDDGGNTWSNIYADTVLIEPICQASMLSYSKAKKGPSLLLFMNPADRTARKNMTLRVSYDEGKTWAISKPLYDGPSAYSDITNLKGDSFGLLYEAGKKSPYEGIVFQRISEKEITGR